MLPDGYVQLPAPGAGDVRGGGFVDRAVLCDELREWDYGGYAGLTTAEIRTRDPGWDLRRDGCPGGDRPGQVGVRVDRMLALVRRRYARAEIRAW